MRRDRIEQIISEFGRRPIIVLGDFMIDEYIFGAVERISPEAPVPVVEQKRVERIPGGAGNVVCNLRALGVPVIASGISGFDDRGQELEKDLVELGVEQGRILFEKLDRPTTRKTRIFAANQQVCRLDLEDRSPISEDTVAALMKRLDQPLAESAAVILSDYDKGVIVPELINRIVERAARQNAYVAVDPQVTHFSQYRNVDILTPNHHEAGRFLLRELKTDEAVEAGGKEILERLNCKSLLITRGEKGMSLIEPDRTRHFPTVATEVFDVTGAGDTVISVFTLVMSSGGTLEEAVHLSNYAAGLVIRRIGAATVQAQELLGAATDP
ncbi:MAG: D-glycero-beta-D-manno-heptose-7-phosphate kinase [Leptospiraceae bacterium]|nr:D-glycero-beta-D-manno-heptose-7-phosphate kinase [Leptospiraceae bacterium]